MNGLEAYDLGTCTSRTQLSDVYQARHRESGTDVAIKRIRILDMHPALRRECETEVNLLQMLEHPNLIKYYAHFVHDGDLYLVMELATGGTLAQRVQGANEHGKPIEEHLLWRWLYDVAGALAYLHQRRILHRDVKPSHLFLGETGQAKLGDFGLSKAMSITTQCAFSCVGTPFYMSPEMVRGEGYSFSSDVWSLGCSLYEVAAGLPPFFRNDKDFKALGAAICSASYPPLPVEVWSQEFIDIVRDILAVAPEQRPSAQGILDAASRKMVSRIQDFKIIGTLGRGNFSEVHRSIWKAGGDREVALKRIQIFEMDAEARKECSTEVNMLKRLEHATIIKYLDSFIENSELVIVLELAAHGDLAHTCRQLKHEERKLSEPQIWAIFYQAGDALHHMHKNRIMHRDIKPANIFMCQHGVVKLGDLGLGRYFSSNTCRAHSVVGTPFYMSPEVITGSSGYDFKSDVWGLGCVLYELATLRCPFAMPGLNYYTLGNKIKNAEYPPLPQGTPERVCSLISKVLCAQQEARPDTPTVWMEAGVNLVEAVNASMPRKSRAWDDSAPADEEEQSQQVGDGGVARRRLARAAAVVRTLLDGPSRQQRPTVPSVAKPAVFPAVPPAPAGPELERRLAQSCSQAAGQPIGPGPVRAFRGTGGYGSADTRRPAGRVAAGAAVSTLGAGTKGGLRAPTPARAASPRQPVEPREPRESSRTRGASSRGNSPGAISPRPATLAPLRAASREGLRAPREDGALAPAPPGHAPPSLFRQGIAAQMAREICLVPVPPAAKQLGPLRAGTPRTGRGHPVPPVVPPAAGPHGRRPGTDRSHHTPTPQEGPAAAAGENPGPMTSR